MPVEPDADSWTKHIEMREARAARRRPAHRRVLGPAPRRRAAHPGGAGLHRRHGAARRRPGRREDGRRVEPRQQHAVPRRRRRHRVGAHRAATASWPTAASATARCGCGPRTGKLIATGSQTASMRYLFDEGELPNLPQRPGAGPGLETGAMLDPELFLPEPEPREVHATIISVDDHLVEPPGMFEGRLPSHLQDRAPRIVVNDWGHEVWEFDGQQHTPGRHERRRRPPPRDREGRAVPLRPDAPGLLRRRRPRRTTWTSTACGRRSASRR